MRDVSEIGLLRLNTRCHLERLGDAQMSWMGFLAQGIDDQTFDSGNGLRDFIRHGTAITEVRDQIAPGTGNHVAVHFRPAVRHRQCRDFGFA